MAFVFGDVRSWGQSGKHMLALSFSAFDPGCVKTCTSQECAELFSLSSSLSGDRKHFWFSNLRNRDGISTRRLNVGVFTRPRPKAVIRRGQFKAYAGSLVPRTRSSHTCAASPYANFAFKGH